MKPLPHDSGQDGLGISFSCQFCASSCKQFGALSIPPDCFLKDLSNIRSCLPVEVREFANDLTDRIDLLFAEWSKKR